MYFFHNLEKKIKFFCVNLNFFEFFFKLLQPFWGKPQWCSWVLTEHETDLCFSFSSGVRLKATDLHSWKPSWDPASLRRSSVCGASGHAGAVDGFTFMFSLPVDDQNPKDGRVFAACGPNSTCGSSLPQRFLLYLQN